MNPSKYISIILLTLLNFISVKADDKIYGRDYTFSLLYMHPFVNYSFPQSWENIWQAGHLVSNGLRLNFGSITSNDLLCEFDLAINEPMGGGWRFRERIKWYESRHQNRDIFYNYLGVEKIIYQPLSIYLTFNPSRDKEYADCETGLIFADTTQKKVFQAGLVLEDFVYEEKNGLGGSYLRKPVGIAWDLSLPWQKWRVYSTGRISSGFIRNYPDQVKSPLLRYHKEQQSYFQTNFRYLSDSLTYLSVLFSLYDFSDEKRYTEWENNTKFQNFFYHGALIWQKSRGQEQWLRIEGHLISQSAEGRGQKIFNYKRLEFLPAIFYGSETDYGIWEAGYMVTIYDWDYSGKIPISNYKNHNYADKIKLGWLYTFNPKSALQISISHEVSSSEFGGGDIQYMVFF